MNDEPSTRTWIITLRSHQHFCVTAPDAEEATYAAEYAACAYDDNTEIVEIVEA